MTPANCGPLVIRVVYGLRRSFLSSGAQMLLTSLWSLSDRATQALMTNYYDRLAQPTCRRTRRATTRTAMIPVAARSTPGPIGSPQAASVGDVMRLTYAGPVTRTHPETVEEAWFSQLHNFHRSNSAEFWHASQVLGWALFSWIAARERWRLPEDRLSVAAFDGQGTPVTREEALGVRRAIWREARTFDWQRGDLLITDNLLVLHGRRPFRGERRVYAALAR